MINPIRWCVLIGISFFIIACGDSDAPSAPQKVDVSDAAHFIVSTDHEGYVNIHALNHDNSLVKVMAFQFIPDFPGAGPMTLGEVKFHHDTGTTLVIVQSGADANNNGGILAFKAGHTVEEQNTAEVKLVPLPSTLTVNDDTSIRPTRLVHTYLDPDGAHLWANNDGPSGDAGADSVFKIDIASLMTGPLEATEILVGNGHKKSAFMHGTNNPKLFVTHNGGDGSYSVISNDGVTAPTVVRTIETTSVDADTRESFHGMASSPVNGQIYVGSTRNALDLNAIPPIDAQIAVSTLDTTPPNVTPTSAADYVVGSLPNGTPPAGIPASGYMLESHDGNRVYGYGWKVDDVDNSAANGYVTIIDSSNDDNNFQVVTLPNIGASSIDIATLTDTTTTPATVTQKLFIPSRLTDCFGSNHPPAHSFALTNKILVLNLDANGDPVLDANEDPVIDSIDVGTAPCHRNGEVSSDNRFVVYPDGCRSTTGCDVDTVKIIHTDDYHVDTIRTQGKNPGTAIFIAAEDILTGGTGGHTHGTGPQ